MINDTFQILNLQQRRIATPLFTNAKQAFMGVSSPQKYNAKYLVIDSAMRLPQKIFMESNISPVFIYSNRSYIFQEGVSLYQYFLSKKDSDIVLRQEQIWRLLQQIVRALILLRECGYQHRHIKQYAIRRINADNYKLVFHPTIVLPQQLIEQRTYNWYNFYLAPQQLEDLSNEESTSCVFSLGCLVLNVMNPWDFRRDIYSRSQFRVNGRVLDEKLDNARRVYSSKIMDIVRGMLHEDYTQRLTLYRLINTIQKVSPFNKKIELTSTLKHLVNYKLSKSKEKINSPPKIIKHSPQNDTKPRKSSKNRALQINFERGTFGGTRQDSSNQKQKKSRGQMQTSFTKGTLVDSTSKDQLKPQVSNQNNWEEKGKRSYSEYFKQNKSKQLNKKEKSMKQDLGRQITTGQVSVSQRKGHIKVGISINEDQQKPMGYNQYIIQTANKKKIKVGVSRQEFQTHDNPYQEQTTPDKRYQKQADQPDNYQINRDKQRQKAIVQSRLTQSQLDEEGGKIEHSLKMFNSKVQSYSLKLADCLQQPLFIAKKLRHPGVWINGNVYYGQFKHGRRNGLALEIFENKEYYYGYYHDDMFHGQGFYYWNAHEHFLGVFEAGSKIEGTWWGKNKYSGQIKDNQRHGIGSYYYYNGKIYEGEWFVGKRHGEGIIVQPSGEKFVGTFKLGKKWGAGSYLLEGCRVNGVWDGQAAVGKVEIIYENGRIYKGFINEYFEMHGEGELRFTNGSVCTGSFEAGDFVFGELAYENGEKYMGQIKDYRRHGRGRYTYNDGREVFAEWRNNKNVGVIEE